MTSSFSSSAGTGGPATAAMTVPGAPILGKSFAPSLLQLFGTGSTLTFTITNPNAAADLIDIAFSDTLPSGLAISTPSGLTGNCGGTVTADAATNSITLSGGSLAPGASCTISVSVSGTAIGVVTNTTSTITASSSEIALVGEPATAQAEVNALFFLWFFHESGGGKP